MISTINKYFSPFQYTRKETYTGLLVYSIWVSFDLLSVYFLAEITQALESWNMNDLYSKLVVYWILILAFNIIIYFWKNSTWVILWSTYSKAIHRKYIVDYIHLDTTYTEKVWTGKSLSIIEKWVSQRALSLMSILHIGSKLTLTLLYLIIIFWSVGFFYMVSFVLILLICVFFGRFCNEKVILARANRINANHWYSKQLVKIIMSKSEILQSWNIDKEIKNLDFYKNEYSKYSKLTNPWIHWFYFWPRIFIDIWRLWLFIYAWWLIINTNWSVSEIVLLWWWLIFLDQIINSALTFYKDITRDFDYVKKMREFFEDWQTEYDINAWDHFAHEWGDIILDTVSFSYWKSKVLDWLSLMIQWNKKTALVWPSGAWKSTIVKLIAWYIRPDVGKIIVNSQNLSEISLKSYYKHIWYLTQEPSVFDGTIRENLMYASESSTKQEIQQAITLAKCDFIYEFADGLETEIGERGIRLSGWQRQRLAIAKIFLKNPEILILDEPTSALDSFSEEAITQAMNELFKNRTVIIIAHRLQTVKHADDIILLDDGMIVERWTHIELVEAWGQYAKMLELQSWF